MHVYLIYRYKPQDSITIMLFFSRKLACKYKKLKSVKTSIVRKYGDQKTL